MYEIRGAKDCFPTLLDKGERMLVFLPLAHVLARAITLACFANKVTLGFTSDIKNLVPTFGVFKPTLVVSVPRVFEKVYNTAEQNARNDGKGWIFEPAVNTAIEYSQAQDKGGPGLPLRAKHAVFDRLVYASCAPRSAATAAARSRAARRWVPGSAISIAASGLTIYEGYGLTETSAAITVNRIDDVKVGSVGKLLPRQQHAPGRRRRTARQGRCGVQRLLAQRTGGPRPSSPAAGSIPATSARSTTTAS
jgi:long-chain acyl-CoA synthetase